MALLIADERISSPIFSKGAYKREYEANRGALTSAWMKNRKTATEGPWPKLTGVAPGAKSKETAGK